jgi:hypothetical protein
VSAWSVGSGVAVKRQAPVVEGGALEGVADRPATDDPPTVDTLVAWIPGEVIAAYAAIVLALQPEGGDPPVANVTSGWWLSAAIAAAAVLTFLGAFSKSDDLTGGQWLEVGVRMILSGAAFAIWSLVVPGSWWYSIESFADNTKLVPIVAGIAGAAFGLLAQGIVRRLS